MSYENLLMQNVVASVEATDDIPRRFITFMRGLVERPDDFHFKFGERTCKIATLKSQFAVDNGGCAGHIVIETESEHQKESRGMSRCLLKFSKRSLRIEIYAASAI